MFSDGSIHQLPDVDPQETGEWLESLDAVIDVQGQGAGALPARAAHGAGARAGCVRPRDGDDRLHQHDPARTGAVVPGQRGHRAPDPRVRALERGRDGRSREPPLRRPGRSPLHLRVGRVVVRGRVQPLLPRQGRRRLRRPDLLPGSRRAGHLRPRVPRGSPHRGSARPLPPRDDGPRPAVVPAPAPAADVLGVPDRLDGARPAQRGLPGALQPLPLQPQDRRHVERAGVVLRRRRRDGRARSDGRARPRGARTARQPDLRRQLQPAAARRSGARRRQGHPGVRVDVPRHGLERDQGRLGPAVGRAARPRRRRRARQQDEHDRRRRVPEVRGRVGRVHPRALLRSRPAPAQDGRAPLRRRAATPAARWSRLPQDLRGVQDRGGARGHAHGHPRQDREGLDARRRLRGAQRDAPDQEDVARSAEGAARPALHGDPRQGSRERAWRRTSIPATSRRSTST